MDVIEDYELIGDTQTDQNLPKTPPNSPILQSNKFTSYIFIIMNFMGCI